VKATLPAGAPWGARVLGVRDALDDSRCHAVAHRLEAWLDLRHLRDAISRAAEADDAGHVLGAGAQTTLVSAAVDDGVRRVPRFAYSAPMPLGP